eukprot:jgi/Ulvmu1/525/UM001_0533.1
MGDLKVVQEFIKVLLQWNYGEMFKKYGDGEGIVDILPAVPKKFSGLEDYRKIFEMMIMEETLAQLMQGSDAIDITLARPAVLMSSSHVAGFLEARLLLSQEHADKFSHADLLLLDRTNPMDDSNAAALVEHAIGHTDGRDDASLRVKFFFDPDAKAGEPAEIARIKSMNAKMLQPMTRWWVLRLGNIATVSREWAAVKRLQFLPMSNALLKGGAQPAPRARRMEVPSGLMHHLRTTFNESQLQAVTAGLDGRPFVLIQGPPGTGKTQTIMGLLSVLKNTARQGTVITESAARGDGDRVAGLVCALRSWQLAAPWLDAPAHKSCARSQRGPCNSEPGSNQDWFGLAARPPVITLGRSKLTKSRILVCAPSNAALDEIVLRVLRQGLLSGAGAKVVPSIVRAGVAQRMHASISGVTLESLVNAAVGDSSDYHERDAAATRILDNADVVFSTLAFSGGSVFRKVSVPFDTVVIDEAAQALEPSCLVPLTGSVKQVYMVGDPSQLPATVMSKRAVQANYQQSLFKRLQDAGAPVQVLRVQYRMNPLISRFASDTFYEGQIEDGPNVVTGTRMPYHKHAALGPLAFYHVKGEEYNPEGSASIRNDEECDMVLVLVKCLIAQHAPLGTEPLIGVISPYKAQVKAIQERLAAALPSASAFIDVNTIDGFQGREKDVIIFSTVRTSAGKSGKRIGFVADERRVNVGLTRARCSLLVVGQRRILQRDENWEALLKFVSDQGTLYDAKPKFESFVQSVLAGKVAATKFTPTPKDPEVFFPSSGDDNILSRKRAAGPAQRKDKRPRR